VTRGRLDPEDCPNFLREEGQSGTVIKVDWPSREKDVFQAPRESGAVGSRSAIVKRGGTAVFAEGQ
jgi:hypothetical protein